MADIYFILEGEPTDALDHECKTLAEKKVARVKIDGHGYVEYEKMQAGTQLKLLNGISMLAQELVERTRENFMSTFEAKAFEIQLEAEMFQAMLGTGVGWKREVILSNEYMLTARIRYEDARLGE